MVGRLFQNCRSKNAVFAPTNRDYINSMVSKIDSICTAFDSIIRGGVHVHRLDFMNVVARSFTTEIHVFVWKSTRPIHTTRNRNLGTGLDLHMHSKDLPRGCCYFTLTLMSFSFKSYCLLLSCFAVRLMCIGYQWLSLFSVCLRVSVHLAIPCVHLAWKVSFTVSF